jgi:hypothetical protein
MMRTFRFALAVAVSVAAAPAARAGVYCSLDQLPYPVPNSFAGVNIALAGVRSPRNAVEGQDQRRKEYLKRADELRAKQKQSGLTVDECVELSGVYLRLGDRYDDAIDVLKGADQRHFLVLAHLAEAYHQKDPQLWDRAVFYQQQALKAWPAVSLRWSLEQLTWYRRAEQYYLEMLYLRNQERLAKKQSWDTVDALFPRLRFETPDAGYEVGGPSRRGERPAEDAPQDALAVVTQLMFWAPFDNRLAWLYGELLNHRGDVTSAQEVFKELVEKRKLNATVRPLYKHYLVLEDGAKAWKQALENRHELMFLARPPALLAPPGAGPLALEASQVGAAAAAKSADSLPPNLSTSPGRDAAAPAGGTWLPDWRTVAVSFAAGLFVMALLQFQWREWSRRRERALAARRELTS